LQPGRAVLVVPLSAPATPAAPFSADLILGPHSTGVAAKLLTFSLCRLVFRSFYGVILMISNTDLDATDRALLLRLMRTGRATWADLADGLGLTAPAIAQRVRRLEERGVIRQFTAWVDPAAVAPVTAFVAVELEQPEMRDRFAKALVGVEQVQEGYLLAGDHDYVLKIRAGSLAELERLVSVRLARLPGVSRLRTTVVLGTVKESPVLPLSEAA